MTIAISPDAGLTPGVVTATSVDGLAAIRNPGCGAAIWCRSPLSGFQSWLDALPPGKLPDARVVLRPSDARDVASQVCAASGTPEGPEQAMLIDDIAALANMFAQIIDARWLRLRLDPINTDACRRFHIDMITARLVCTYRGAGTQYGNAAAGTDPQVIQTVPTGAPILLRGKLWPTRPDAGLVHRSPPIEGTGQTRLVLVIDPVDDAGADG